MAWAKKNKKIGGGGLFIRGFFFIINITRLLNYQAIRKH